ncbi:diguanylate phosphodiesterase [Oxalicibacterium solurbis]|uniref:Diguanylate phosphodiesterase n=2 Tax=Oxalicibacterium solurbis TaxID=69280 RepID=A0A8J3F3A0_9BURK|nr:diguanylate phosphodiesterase [Oxalicibacterium solurbis]
MSNAAHDFMTSTRAQPANDQDDHIANRLRDVLLHRRLTPLFQPIVDMQNGQIIGYEGLIRGPSDSPLHSPLNLFKAARACNLSVEVEHLCRRITLEKFAELQLPGKLFLNVSPECLVQPDVRLGETLGYIHEVGINPERVIIELTESHPTYDYDLLREAVKHYRAMGFVIAIDDLGEGFSSLRLWSEIRPEYVKIDMHFVQGINQDPIKLQFVRSIQEIAEKSGTLVIAEGIETDAELLMIRDLGVRFGQGYKIARPNAHPITTLPAELCALLNQNNVAVYPHEKGRSHDVLTAAKLLRHVKAVSPEVQNNRIYEMFNNDPTLEIIPVVSNGLPLGLITRANLIDNFARPYLRELHGKKSCTLFMDANPLIADKNTALHTLSQLIVDADRHHLFNGFIITDNGQYAGMGNAHDLMREITQMQINAARYANPLTLLPGNVPIDEHIDRLLAGGAHFCVCYVDLDHFKPYNDVYGYRKGDDVLRLTGRILSAHCDPERDFVGHIGGDDFIILFQSTDWEWRCRQIIDVFAAAISGFYSEEHRNAGGYISEDRRGKKVFHALATISLGLLKVEPGVYGSHHQIATAAADSKKQAKKIPGNSLFIDRRLGPFAGERADSEESTQADPLVP